MIGATGTLEVLFGLPGVSQFVILSVPARDHGVLLAYVMVVAGMMALANLAIAATLHLIDPRAA
jgi:peptide/nickel transport system permease protein